MYLGKFGGFIGFEQLCPSVVVCSMGVNLGSFKVIRGKLEANPIKFSRFRDAEHQSKLVKNKAGRRRRSTFETRHLGAPFYMVQHYFKIGQYGREFNCQEEINYVADTWGGVSR